MSDLPLPRQFESIGPKYELSRQGNSVRVLIAADAVVMRAGLESLLNTHPELTVIASSTHLATLTQQVEALQPDVILLEWQEALPEKLLELGTVTEELNLVILGNEPQGNWVTEAIHLGVRAVLPREATAEEIVATVIAAATGLVVIHPDLMDALLPVPPIRPLPSELQSLTRREIEVLSMLAVGLGNKAIARRLTISEHTVKFHVSSIFSKLNASSRTEAVTLGARQGLIML